MSLKARLLCRMSRITQNWTRCFMWNEVVKCHFVQLVTSLDQRGEGALATELSKITDKKCIVCVTFIADYKTGEAEQCCLKACAIILLTLRQCQAEGPLAPLSLRLRCVTIPVLHGLKLNAGHFATSEITTNIPDIRPGRLRLVTCFFRQYLMKHGT